MPLRNLAGWIVLGTFLFPLGCASTPPQNIIFQDKYNSVRLEGVQASADPDSPSMQFDHPFEITAEDMERLLGSVQVVIPPGFIARVLFKNKAVPELAFTEEEIQQFAPIFVEAFMKAGSDELVVFFLHHQRVVYKGNVSSGMAFFKDGRFNLVFGRYRLGNQPGKPDINVKGLPLTSTNGQTFYLSAGEFQNLITEERFPLSGKTLFPRRWLAIDHAALLSSPIPEVREISLEEMASKPAEGAEPVRTVPQPELSMEEKLRTLKHLSEEGLITEEEYMLKRKELIQSF